jgi:hypothetical protein
MKVEILSPSKGGSFRDFTFTAYVKRLTIKLDEQFSKFFYTIVEQPIGTITVYRHGIDGVKLILRITEDGEEVKL